MIILIKPRCAVCNKPVDSVELFENVMGDLIRVECHGERVECFITHEQKEDMAAFKIVNAEAFK